MLVHEILDAYTKAQSPTLEKIAEDKLAAVVEEQRAGDERFNEEAAQGLRGQAAQVAEEQRQASLTESERTMAEDRARLAAQKRGERV